MSLYDSYILELKLNEVRRKMIQTLEDSHILMEDMNKSRRSRKLTAKKV